jgi:beta-mannan synthase
MSLHRTKATLIGLLEAGRVNEWVVTEKIGAALNMKMAGKASKKPRMKIGDRYVTQIYLLSVHFFLTLVAEHFIWN